LKALDMARSAASITEKARFEINLPMNERKGHITPEE